MALGKGIPVINGFDLNSKLPLDSRAVADTMEEMNKLVTDGSVGDGQPCYCKADKKFYMLKDGVWSEVGGGGGDSIPIVEGTLSDETFTINNSQDTAFILHSSEVGYVFMSNANGQYAGAIPVSQSAAYVFTGSGTSITLSFAFFNAVVEGTLTTNVGNLYNFTIPEEQTSPFLLSVESFLLYVLPTDEGYKGSIISSDSNGFFFLSISGKETNINVVKQYLAGTISTITLGSTLTITSAQFDDLISSPNNFLVFYGNNASSTIVYNNNNELVISFISINVRDSNILYTDLIYTANKLEPTIKQTLTKISKNISLFGKHSILVPKDSTDANIDLYLHSITVGKLNDTYLNGFTFLFPSSSNLVVDSIQDLNTLLGTTPRMIPVSGCYNPGTPTIITRLNWKGSFTKSTLITTGGEEDDILATFTSVGDDVTTL